MSFLLTLAKVTRKIMKPHIYKVFKGKGEESAGGVFNLKETKRKLRSENF